MRKRVEETLDLLGLADLRNRPLAHAVRRAAAAGRDRRGADHAPAGAGAGRADVGAGPAAAEEVLAALQRLVHDLGLTVVLAEHRLERVVQYADRIVHVPGGALPVESGDPGDDPRDRAGRPAGGRARSRRRLVAASPVGARRPPTVRCDLRARLDAVRPPEHAAHALNGEVGRDP